MDSRSEQWKMIFGNIALTQAQAIVVGFMASISAMILGWIPKGKFDVHHGFLLCSSSVLTASFASLVLGSILNICWLKSHTLLLCTMYYIGTVMIIVVIASRKCNINPDNVATPIAASLGDLTTLSLLAAITSMFYKILCNQTYLCMRHNTNDNLFNIHRYTSMGCAFIISNVLMFNTRLVFNLSS